MPLYAFACAHCGTRFDSLKTLRERQAPETCPKCGQPAARAMSGYSVAGKSAAGSSRTLSAPSACSSGGG